MDRLSSQLRQAARISAEGIVLMKESWGARFAPPTGEHTRPAATFCRPGARAIT